MTVNYLDTDGPSSVTPPTASNQPLRASQTDESLVPALLQAVEAATGIDAIDLPPLHDAVDPDALNALVRSTDQSLHVTFDYAGLVVAIDGDGEISLPNPENL